MTVSKKVLTRITVASLVLIAGIMGIIITKNNHNAIHITNKTVTDDTTAATMANYVYTKNNYQLIHVTNFNPNQVSGIKTLYLASRLHKDASHYLSHDQINQEDRLFLFDALKSKITGENNLSKITFGPLSALDVYILRDLQAQHIVNSDYKYTTVQQDSKLMRVLQGERLNVNAALTEVTDFNLLTKMDNTGALTDLLANILTLRQAKLTDKQMRKLERVWEYYQQRNISKLALTMSDKSFVILAEFEKNLSRLLQQNSFFDLKVNDIASVIYQPEAYPLDDYRNVAFLLAGQYYTQNVISKEQLNQLIDKLTTQADEQKTAADAYYLNMINQVIKTKISKSMDIPSMKQADNFNNNAFYNYLVTNSQPTQNNDTRLLSQIRFYGLHEVHPAGKKFLQQLAVETILNSPKEQRSEIINEYVLALKKYNLLKPKIKIKLLTYLQQHENVIYGYTLEANRAYTLTSSVYALQVKSILTDGNSLDIH